MLDIRGEIPTEVPVPENWSLTPSGLVGGEKFRLMFITGTGTRRPNSTEIEDYNAYVQSQAKASNAHTDIKDYAYHFRVLGSTADVDARDNTKTNPNDYTSVPIYWMGGTKVADNYGDFYDGTWDDETNPTNRSGSSSSRNEVFTGTGDSGSKSSKPLGSSNSVTLGRLNSSTGDPLDGNIEGPSNSHAKPYYALSNIFVVPNSDATGQPAVTGTPRVNETLSVDTSGITDPEGTDNANFEYQWVSVDGDSETDIDGATQSTYRPTQDEDADKKIKVKVSFKDDQGFDEGPLVSERSARIVSRDVLVSNNTLANDLDLGFTAAAPITAQGFTTGADADGYTLESVSVGFGTIPNLSTAGAELTATIRAESGAAPGTTLCTLVDPQSFAQGHNTFTAPSTGTICPVLSTNTTYFFAIEHHDPANNATSLKATNSNSEDAGSRLGWLILDYNHYYESTWKTDSASIIIQVNGHSAVESIVSDYTTWVDNRQGDTTTEYENTGSFTIAQGFRTGDTAGIFEVHEIHLDFDTGQSETETIQVRIVESTAPDDDWEYATPSGFWKGGNYSPQDVTTGGVHTFRRTSGNSALKANTNYFLVIESTSNDPTGAATVRMTTHEGEESEDGWTVDNYSHSKAKQPNSTWTRQDHQVRFRISGSYREGIGTPGDSYAFESCVELRRGQRTNCIAAIAVPEPADTENPPENVSRSSLVLDPDLFPGINKWWTGWWQWMHEYIAFPVTMNPLPTGNDYVTMSFGTRDHTAISGQDYWDGSGSLRFDANSNHTQIVNIRIIDDRVEDSGDYFNFYIYQCRNQDGDSCDHLFVDSSVKGIIYNTEESAEIAYLKVSDVTVTEGDGATADFTVSLTAPTTAAVHFDYATEDGTARDGADYTGGSGSAFLANGDTSVTISVPISNDETWTGDRSFTLKISDAVYAAISDDSGKATIKDDEPQPLVARFTNIPSGNHGESSFTFNISFNQDVSTQHLVMQNDALTVTNGEITRAERISGSRDFWRITVQPDSGTDVTVHLPATEDCADTGAVCTGGNQPQALSNSVTQTFVGTALNVRFASNANHNGKDAFTAELIFSEQTDTTAAELKDHALTTQSGSITSVAAKTEGSTRAWTVTLQPSGLGHLTITLTGATDCATDGHVCTAGGKLLSHTLIKKVYGPVQLSISDAATTEGEGATLTFTVTAENDTVDKYTVSYATSDGTATAGEDYTATSGVLAYTYGAGPLTVSVPVLSDDETESAETVTLTLSNPSQYVHIKDGQATGTIEDGVQEEETQANSAPTGLPSIPGTPKAGEPLTADTSAINDADGLTGVTYSYQWVRTTGGEDEDIGTATGASYTPDNNDVDKTLKVRVSFEDDVGNDESLTSLPTAAVARSADGTVWSADMLVVEYTEISIGAATADRFSNIGGSGNLQIKSLWSYVPDKDLRLAFTDTFADAEDHTLIVGDLTLEFPAGSSGEQSFKWTNVDLNWEDGRTIAVSIVPTTPVEPVANTPATGLPTITGTSPQVGKALTVDTSGIADQDGLTEVSYSYRWIGNDGNVATNLQHSTVRTYTPSASDVGMTIKVNVSFTDDADNNESLTSIATAAVLATVPTAPSSLTVTAGSQIQELDASWQAPTSNGGSDVTGYKLQWKETADSWDNPADVSEATVTGTTHTITGLTGGVEYAVRVIATNTIGNSPASTEVAGTPAGTVSEQTNEPENNAPTGLPTISGTRKVDETLTAGTSAISDEDGLANVAYRYQWLRDDAEIAGQTNATYDLVSADEGQTIKVRVTFNDDAGNAESLTSAATTAVAARSTPAVLLTASFANVPADHDGGNFTFQLVFSENVDAGYARIRDHAFTLNGATIASASRQTQGSNQGWHVEVDPIGNDEVSITLPETTDCNDSGAICTDDSRKLSHATSVRVAGPPAISVSDASVQEAEEAVLAFSVTLSHPSSRTVTVDYATADGTATAGSDYTATSGSLTFNAGDTSQTVEVTVLTDSDEEGEETLTVTLSSASQASLDDATGTGTILNGEAAGTQEDPPAEDPPAEDPVVDDPVVLVTASITNIPATHDGTPFTFELDFSENVAAGYARIRDHAFTINGGDSNNRPEITSAVRKVQGSNQGWTITVNPNGATDITITLPPTTDCDADGAICTSSLSLLK